MIKIIIALTIIIVLIIFTPLLIIWALNTLFALAIPYTIWTYLATLILTSVVTRPAINRSK